MTDRAQREADERSWAGMDPVDEPPRRDPARCWLPVEVDGRDIPCRGPKVAGRCTSCDRPEPR
jgi:hypothetical protein